MTGYFQKTTNSGQAVPRVKYSADYASLQAAIDDTNYGETLFVNADYTLTSTAEVTKRGVNILGNRPIIRPASNGSPSPLFRVKTTSAGSPLLNGTYLRGLRLESASGVSAGSGTGIAMELSDSLAAGVGSMWHMLCEDVEVWNFARGINLLNAFDVLIQNVQIEECQIGLRCETTTVGKTTGQVKLVGGFIINNQYHLSIDSSTAGVSMSYVNLFGVSIGHQRTSTAGGSTGIFIGKDCGGVSVFGGHMEDVVTGIYGGGGFTTAVSLVGSSVSLAASGANAGVDFTGGGSVGSLCLLGNAFQAGTAVPFYKIASALHGIVVAGNTRAPLGSTPSNGLIEVVPVDGKSVYRIAVYTDATRPSANAVPAGSMIYNSGTSKVNVSDGAVWRDANGTVV